MEQAALKGKSIFILKAPQQRTAGVERYLQNKGWQVKSTSNIKDALLYLAHHAPDFFLISVDHPNKKVRELPRLISKNIASEIVPFTDSRRSEAYRILNASGCKKVLYPPFTGSAVERVLSDESYIDFASQKLRLRAPPKKIIPATTPDVDPIEFVKLLGIARDPNEVAKKKISVEMSALAMGVQSALQQVFPNAVKQNKPKLKNNNPEIKYYCLESHLISGYISIAADSISACPEEFTGSLKKNVSEKLNNAEIQIDIIPKLQLDFSETDFNSWVENTSDFFKSFQFNDSQFAISFHSAEPFAISPIPNDSQAMGSILVQEIQPDHILDFDLFLYLPLNARYHLYVGEGGSLSQDQKDRLISRSVTQFFFRNEDYLQVHSHRARNLFENLIRETHG